MAQVRTEKVSRKISIIKGVPQSDTFSPVMFTASTEEIFKRIKLESGININGVRLKNLRFDDDMILFAKSENELEKILEELNVEGKRDRMELNKRKTNIKCNKIAR